MSSSGYVAINRTSKMRLRSRACDGISVCIYEENSEESAYKGVAMGIVQAFRSVVRRKKGSPMRNGVQQSAAGTALPGTLRSGWSRSSERCRLTNSHVLRWELLFGRSALEQILCGCSFCEPLASLSSADEALPLATLHQPTLVAVIESKARSPNETHRSRVWN